MTAPLLRAEKLVYDLAFEMNLSEAELRRVDAVKLAHELIADIRFQVKQEAGRTLTLPDYLIEHPANVIDLIGWLSSRKRPLSGPA